MVVGGKLGLEPPLRLSRTGKMLAQQLGQRKLVFAFRTT